MSELQRTLGLCLAVLLLPGCNGAHGRQPGLAPCRTDSDCVCSYVCDAFSEPYVPACSNPTGRLCQLAPAGDDGVARVEARGCTAGTFVGPFPTQYGDPTLCDAGAGDTD